MDKKETCIEMLENTVDRHVYAFGDIDDEEWSYKPSPARWSKKEILGHLVDSATVNHHRFIRSQRREHLVFEPYSQDDWVIRHDYQNRPVNEIISLWTGLNRQIGQIFRSISEEKFQKLYDQHNLNFIAYHQISPDQRTNLKYLFQDYIEHMKHHLRQIVGEQGE